MPSIDRLLCSFSPTGTSLAIASPDGRVRVFDTGSGKLKLTLGSSGAGPTGIANGHLTEFHTCVAWVSNGKDKKKQSGSSGLVLGTAAGDVKCYDTQLGELRWQSRGVIEGGVASVACSPAGVVYATGSSCQICTLDAETGAVSATFTASKYAVTCIAVSPVSQQLLGGGSSMQLWNVDSEERDAKFSGHPSEVRAIAFSPEGQHATSSAAGERQVAVWDVHSACKRPKRQHPAVATLSVEDPVVHLHTCASSASAAEANGSSGGGGSSFHVAAVSEAGEAYVWLVAAGGAGGAVSAELVARVRVGQEVNRGAVAGKQEGVLAAHLQHTGAGVSLLVARGTSAKPAFESIPIPSAPHAASTSTSQQNQQPTGASAIIHLAPAGGALLPPSENGVKPDKSIAKQKAGGISNAGVSVLGSENLGHAVLLRAAAEQQPAAGKKKRGASDAADDGSSSKGVEEVVEEEEESVEELLMDRVAALEAASTRGGAGEEEGVAGGGSGGSGRLSLPAGNSNKADSLSVLLTQALRSGDNTLLERCLSSSASASVINNTIARIVTSDAALLLKACVDRLLSKPARAVQLVPFLRALLHHHTGYLMTAPGVQAPLMALFQAIDARVRLHEPLLKVFGRLGLLSHHAQQAALDPSSRSGGGLPPPESTLIDESGDDEPVAEDAFAPAEVSDDEDEDEDEESQEDDGADGSGSEDFDALLEGGDGDDMDSEED
ncbi:MAG: hypothetical protein WDW38_009035 [Sanguina aurantia]